MGDSVPKMNLTNEIDVWMLSTNQSAETQLAAEKCLEDGEITQAAKFLRPELRTRFILRRAGMRQVLARYLGLAPGDLRFEYSLLGKPKLASRNEIDLQFNMSHSGEWAAIAVCVGSRIGIDIERVRKVENAAGIVERFYSPEEWLFFSKLSECEKDKVFLKTWTCKEAYIKATGEGLSFPLDRVEICVESAASPPSLKTIHGRPGEPSNWSLIELIPNPNWVGAIVVEGGQQTVRFNTFEFH